MQCLNPVLVPNQSRFINYNTRHPLLVMARCGKCASCQQNKSAEWSFRAFKHAEDCFCRGGYVLFDTLTYSDKYVPRLSNYSDFSLLTPSEDYMCFSSEDLRLFHVNLRKRLRKLGFEKGVYSYFCATEYGTSEKHTHRPHYHLLFYVYEPVPPLVFSELVAKAWKFGRTDGVPWKSRTYVNSNIFRSLAVGSRRVVNYVTKYVQKSSAFERIIDKRIKIVLHRLAPDMDWLNTDACRQKKRELYRVATQFHRQSIGFGASALADEPVRELFERGFFKMPNGNPSMFTRIPISNYYLRKVCYYKHTLDDGYQLWLVRPFAKELLELRSASLRRNLSHHLRQVSFNAGLNGVDFDSLSDYLLDWRGRLLADDMPEKSPLGVLRSNIYMYGSIADKNHFNMRFLSLDYLGYKDHYRPVSGRVFPVASVLDSELCNQASLPAFNGYDDFLAKIDAYNKPIDINKQAQFEHLQHLNDVWKCFN